LSKTLFGKESTLPRYFAVGGLGFTTLSTKLRTYRVFRVVIYCEILYFNESLILNSVILKYKKRFNMKVVYNEFIFVWKCYRQRQAK